MSKRHETQEASATVLTTKENDLRQELATAISTRVAADSRAKLAAEVDARAATAFHDVEVKVIRIERERDASTHAATEKAAKAAADALRAGSPIPAAIPVAESPNMASLALLQAHRDALEKAHATLAAEHDSAKQEAAKAAHDVGELVNAILDLEIETYANETLAIQQALWHRMDSLEGVFQMRKEPELQALKDRIKQGLRRDKYLVSEQPQLIEQHHWDAHMIKLRSEAETQWREFAIALANDATAELQEKD